MRSHRRGRFDRGRPQRLRRLRRGQGDEQPESGRLSGSLGRALRTRSSSAARCPGQTACGTLTTCYDAGAIRLDNPGPTDITVGSVSVDIHSSIPGGKTFNLWGSFTVPAGQERDPHREPARQQPELRQLRHERLPGQHLHAGNGRPDGDDHGRGRGRRPSSTAPTCSTPAGSTGASAARTSRSSGGRSARPDRTRRASPSARPRRRSRSAARSPRPRSCWTAAAPSCRT